MDAGLIRKLDFLYDLLVIFRAHRYQLAKGAFTMYPDDIAELDIGENYASFTENGRFYIVDTSNTRWVYQDKGEYQDKVKELGF